MLVPQAVAAGDAEIFGESDDDEEPQLLPDVDDDDDAEMLAVEVTVFVSSADPVRSADVEGSIETETVVVVVAETLHMSDIESSTVAETEPETVAEERGDEDSDGLGEFVVENDTLIESVGDPETDSIVRVLDILTVAVPITLENVLEIEGERLAVDDMEYRAEIVGDEDNDGLVDTLPSGE